MTKERTGTLTIADIEKELKNNPHELFGTPIRRIARCKLGDFDTNGKSRKSSEFDFNGVYIIYLDDGTIVYLGKAPQKKVKDRLYLQIKGQPSNSTLSRHYSRNKYAKTRDSLNSQEVADLLADMREFNVLAVECNDLENDLIVKTNNTCWNIAGNR